MNVGTYQDDSGDPTFAQEMGNALQGFDSFMELFAGLSPVAGTFMTEAVAGLVSGAAESIMLGSNGWVEVGGIVGAKVLNIPNGVWQGMTVAEQQTTMTGFIDTALLSGAQIAFTNNPALAPAGSGLAFEYAYITGKLGLQIVAQGTGWVVVP